MSKSVKVRISKMIRHHWICPNCNYEHDEAKLSDFIPETVTCAACRKEFKNEDTH